LQKKWTRKGSENFGKKPSNVWVNSSFREYSFGAIKYEGNIEGRRKGKGPVRSEKRFICPKTLILKKWSGNRERAVGRWATYHEKPYIGRGKAFRGGRAMLGELTDEPMVGPSNLRVSGSRGSKKKKTADH